MISDVLKFTILIILTFLTFHSYADEKLCSTVVVHGKKMKFSDTEKQLVCGDKKSDAWKNIPDYEASFIMSGFLQSRGYLKPEYKTEEGVLHVHPGKIFKIKRFDVISENKKLRKEVKKELNRLFRKRILSTDVLNSVEAEALALVRQRGYPCAKVKSQVDISKSEVRVELNESNYFEFGPLTKESVPGLRENALDRFYPFKANQMFNADLLTLTEKRMTRQEVVPGTYFVESCEEDNTKFKLSQSFINGPPRTIRFGAGASTEQGPMARARWQNNRYKSMASQLSANIQASLRTQSITLSADSYFWHNEPRRSLFTTAEIVRESQVDYEQLIYRLEPLVKWTRDSENYSKVYTLGPSYEGGTYHADQNTNTKSFSTGILKGSAVWMAHKYELFDFHPQEGNLAGINFDFRHPSMGFSDPLLKLDSTVVGLNRLGNWGRGTIIGGVRFNAGTTWVDEDVTLNGLPPTVKFFGGGSDDIRGFTLKTLPGHDGLGALTKLSTKLELRRTYLFIESLEGFTFIDIAKFGDRSWNIDKEMFYSPGFGLRWLSPIGMVQGFVARALQVDPYKDQGNFYFLGLGGVF
jgi:translocation and assembly module TamA